MIVYLDASVVTSVIVQEPGWQAMVAMIGSRERTAYSDFGLGEVVSAIAIRARSQSLDMNDAARTISRRRILVSDWQRILIDSRDIDSATGLVERITLNLRLPDAIHIAVARRLDATLITTDRQRHRAALAIGTSAINPLEPSH